MTRAIPSQPLPVLQRGSGMRRLIDGDECAIIPRQDSQSWTAWRPLVVTMTTPRSIYLPVSMDNKSWCNPEAPVAPARDPPERASCSLDRGRLENIERYAISFVAGV